MHEVGNGDRRQEADNGHDDHDFHQCETRLTDGLGRFHLCLLFIFNLLLGLPHGQKSTLAFSKPTVRLASLMPE
jgi:hypothetical protein